jgi:hypothetical protein
MILVIVSRGLLVLSKISSSSFNSSLSSAIEHAWGTGMAAAASVPTLATLAAAETIRKRRRDDGSDMLLWVLA